MCSTFTGEVDAFFRWIGAEVELSKIVPFVAKHIEIRHSSVENADFASLASTTDFTPSTYSGDNDLPLVHSTSDFQLEDLLRSENWQRIHIKLADDGLCVFGERIQILDVEKAVIEPLHTLKAKSLDSSNESVSNENSLNGYNRDTRLSVKSLSVDASLADGTQQNEDGIHMGSHGSCASASWYALWIQVRTSQGELIRRFFLYPYSNESAKRLAECLCGTVAYIDKLKVFFTSMRQTLLEGEAIQKKWMQDLEEERKRLSLQQGDFRKHFFPGNPANSMLLFQKAWFDALPSEKKEVLKVGFGAQEQSLLEEAVAYTPMSIYMFLSGVPFLLKAQFSGHRLSHEVRALGAYYKKQYQIATNVASVSPHAVSPKSFYATANSTSLRTNLSSASAAASSSREPALRLFHLSGGEFKTSKSFGECEDATFFLSEEGAFGVFDGVGSWSLEGIDASQFSLGLAAECKALAPLLLDASSAYTKLNATNKARLLLDQAHRKLQRDRPDAWGSSTAIVAVFDSYSGNLGVACLGDSVLIVLRRDTMPRDVWHTPTECPRTSYHTLLGSGPPVPRKMRRIVWKTKVQRWENGAPYQLANLPDFKEWEGLRCRGYDRFVDTLHRIDLNGDSTDMAFSPRLPIICQPGDLILAFSDGVSDNLFEEEVESYCTFAVSPEEAAQLGDPSVATPAENIAKIIGIAANRRSTDQVFKQAFVPLGSSKGAYYEQYRLFGNEQVMKGGKKDDISCVACWVIAETQASIDLLLTKDLDAHKAAEMAAPVASLNGGESTVTDCVPTKAALADTCASTPIKASTPLLSNTKRKGMASTPTLAKTAVSKSRSPLTAPSSSFSSSSSSSSSSSTVPVEPPYDGLAPFEVSVQTPRKVSTPKSAVVTRTASSKGLSEQRHTMKNAKLTPPRLPLPKVTTPRKLVKLASDLLIQRPPYSNQANLTATEQPPKTPTGVTAGAGRGLYTPETPTSAVKQRSTPYSSAREGVTMHAKLGVSSPVSKRKDTYALHNKSEATTADYPSSVIVSMTHSMHRSNYSTLLSDMRTPIKQQGRKRSMPITGETASFSPLGSKAYEVSLYAAAAQGDEVGEGSPAYSGLMEDVKSPYNGGMTPRKVKSTTLVKRKRIRK